MKILVIDDKLEEIRNAIKAVQEAGHEAIYPVWPEMLFTEFQEQLVEKAANTNGILPHIREQIINEMTNADGIITDLYFNPMGMGNYEICKEYKKNPPPMGLVVVIHAITLKKPVVICTSEYHHGAKASFVYDSYVACLEKTIFGWEDNKNWKKAVRILENMKPI